MLSNWRSVLWLVGLTSSFGLHAVAADVPRAAPHHTEYDCQFTGGPKGGSECIAHIATCPVIIGTPGTCKPELKVSCDGRELYDGLFASTKISLELTVFQGITSQDSPTPPSVSLPVPDVLPADVDATLGLSVGSLAGKCRATDVLDPTI